VQQQSEALDQSQQTAHALAELAERMLGGVALADGVGQVGAAAEQLSATIQELSGAASEILTAIDQISRGAQSQAAATHQSAAAMTQIERAAATTRAAAAASADQAGALAAQMAQNRDAVSTLSQTVLDAVAETSAVLGLANGLDEGASAIEKIVEDITLVAVQTNMLAVTGAVEAARAGEFGRGFAIVSADIRGLARDAGDNASRIKDVVRQIQAQVLAIRRQLEDIAAAGQAEIGRNAAILERLDAVQEDIQSIRAGSVDILSGTEAMLGAVRDVTAGTHQIATAAEETSGAAAQAATAARQQARGAEDLAAAIEEIASLAEELQTAEAG
jgi:methyl-accepting chemotaxis protein